MALIKPQFEAGKAEVDKGAGVKLFKKLGDRVEQGESLYRIYAQFPADFNFARELAAQNNSFAISDQPLVMGNWEIS